MQKMAVYLRGSSLADSTQLKVVIVFCAGSFFALMDGKEGLK